jgi:3-phytase
MRYKNGPQLTALFVLASFGTAAAAQDAAPDAAPARSVQAAAQSEPITLGGPNRAILLPDATAPANARMVGTAELGGLEIYGLDGKRLGQVPAGEAVGIDARSGFTLGGREVALVASADSTTNSLRFFAAEGGALREVGARAVPLGFAVENLCLFRSVQDGALYAFAVGDGGEIDQHMIFATPDGKVDARQVRRLHVPSTAEHCVADDASGQLYVSEQAVGIWRFVGDPEADASPAIIDAPRLGRITEEVGGLALYDGGEGARWLIASDASSGRLFAYDRSKQDAYVGAVTIRSPGDGAAVEEPGGLFATNAALGASLNQGALLVADEGGANYKMVAMSALAAPLNLSLGSAKASAPASPLFPSVRATVETVPVASAGDAADDPAIWANPDNPAASLFIGTDKKGGLNLYDMQGKVLQYLPVGKMNNVDLREGFPLAGKRVVLVTASDRTNKAVAIYRLDTEARQLVDVADGVQASGLSDPYGLCMHRTKAGRYYVYVGDPDGLLRQWELVGTKEGKVRIRKVREARFDSQAEGCVTDDATGLLYVAEEDVGLWRLAAGPKGSTAKHSMDAVAANGRIKDDLEGVGLYDLGGGRGYFVVSSQGNNSYAVYRREGDQAYLGSFSVTADPATGIDGISETDGLEITSRNLGPGFEHGAMIAQDGRNVLPNENQNFKLVPWSAIAAVLKLESR